MSLQLLPLFQALGSYVLVDVHLKCQLLWQLKRIGRVISFQGRGRY